MAKPVSYGRVILALQTSKDMESFCWFLSTRDTHHGRKSDIREAKEMDSDFLCSDFLCIRARKEQTLGKN